MNYQYGFFVADIPAEKRKNAWNADGKMTAEEFLVDAHTTKEIREWCEKALSSFYFVKWDRFVRTKTPLGPYVFTCYGWIEREQDGYKDFVVINLLPDTKQVQYAISSSAKYSKEIHKLCGATPSLHKQCVRIEDEFNVSNCIRLEKGTIKNKQEQKK